MSNRKKFPDAMSVGQSKVVPFVPDESWRQRHIRRLTTNLAYEPAVRDWVDAHPGWTLKIKNEGHHWMFVKHHGNGRTTWVEWWPSSAKVVINKKWNRGIHCYDFQQLLKLLETNKRIQVNEPFSGRKEMK